MSVFRIGSQSARQRRSDEGSSAVERIGRTKALFAVLAVVLAAVPFLAPTVASGGALAPTRSALFNSGGFPTWYGDSNGVRVDPCIDASDIHCVLVANPGVFDPNVALNFPSNYPDEFFYSVVDSDKITTPGCPGAADPLAANPGTAFVRVALEGAFINGDPAPGDQMTFGRVRVVVRGGLCPGETVNFVTPYGPVQLTTNDAGGIKPVEGTVDVGCRPSPVVPCNWDATLASQHLQIGLLSWDPAVLPAADPGYLGGDPAVLHPITGGVSSSFSYNVVSSGINNSTNLFLVSGRMAGPLQSDRAVIEFGGVQTLAASTPQTVTLTNLTSAGLPITGVAIANDARGEFALAAGGDTCTGTSPAQDASCTVGVVYTPSTTGPSTADLVVSYTGARGTFTVPIAGTGISPGNEPAASPSPLSLDFGSVRLRTISTTQDITVTNTGQAPLLVSGYDVLDAAGNATGDAASFSVVASTCNVAVPAGSTCVVSVRFAPSQVKPYAMFLHIRGNMPVAAAPVALAGTGTGGIAAVSSTIDQVNHFPDWYQDENGMRLGQCIDPTNPLCIVLPDPNYAGGPVVFPTNFPTEFFYFVSDSDVVNVSDATCGAGTGKAMVRMADEGAFTGASADVFDGEQMTFGRERFWVTDGLCAGDQYIITYPYGKVTVTADSAGGLRRAANTSDVGCFPAIPVKCDFTMALSSPVSASYLQQVGHPAGYLGDPKVFAPVTGAPFADPANGFAPANYFKIQRADTLEVIGETNLFTAMGKLVGPVNVTPDQHVWDPPVRLGSAGVDQVFTFTNNGIAPVTASGVTVTGANAGDFTPVTNTCIGAVLDPVSSGLFTTSCTVTVRFAPLGTGVRNGLISLVHTGANSPTGATLSGIGAAPPGSAAISASPTSAAFPALHTGKTSASVAITVSNIGGDAELFFNTAPSFSGTGASQFGITSSTCPLPGTGLAVNGTCTINVHFSPTVVGAATASLVLDSTASTGVLTVPLTGVGSAATATVSGTSTTAGFPTFVGDPNGIRLEPCLTTADQSCVLLADAGFNPANPVVYPTNFPSEFFYFLADSELVSVPKDASCGGAGGTAFLRIATEGSYPGGTVLAANAIWFNRVRVVASGLCPSSPYRFETPYGAVFLASDATGQIRANNGTVDITSAASRPITPGFLVADPNAAPTPPAGYIGDGRSFQKVVGSQYTVPGAAEPANYFEVFNPSGTSLVKSDKFLLSGRLAAPVESTITSRDFGSVALGQQSATTTVTITNRSNVTVTGFTTQLIGTNAADFLIVANTPTNTCAGASLAPNASCTVGVRFTPTAASTLGAKTASLQVGYSGLRSPLLVSLAGNAISPGALSITSPVNFGSVPVGGTATSLITIKNTAPANALNASVTVSSLAFTGSYSRVTVGLPPGSCSTGVITLQPQASCTITVLFTATAPGGVKAGTLTVNSNVTAVVSTLTGTALQAQVTASPTSVTMSTKGSTSATINVTNTGTAPMSFLAPVFTFSPSQGTALTAANKNCTNVAPGAKCSFSITFAPPAADPTNKTYNSVLTVNTNAGNALKITITATKK